MSSAPPPGTPPPSRRPMPSLPVTQRVGRALETRRTITVDSGQLCQVLLTKPLTLPALWQGFAQDTCNLVPQSHLSRKVSFLGQHSGTKMGL